MQINGREGCPEKRDINRGRKIVRVERCEFDKDGTGDAAKRRRIEERGAGRGGEGGGGCRKSKTETSGASSHLAMRNCVLHAPESSFVAIWRLKVKSLPPTSDKRLSGVSATLATRKRNFLCGLLLVNLQAATLINTVQANASQQRRTSINHADVSFLTSPSRRSLARSQPKRRRETRRAHVHVCVCDTDRKWGESLGYQKAGVWSRGDSAASPKREERREKQTNKRKL